MLGPSECSTADDGTSITMSNLDNIPIDPSLVGPGDELMAVKDTEIYQHPQNEVPPEFQFQQPQIDRDDYMRQYAQGPQGDPFAPPPPPIPMFLSQEPEPEATPLAQKAKRRRKQPKREEICGFCEGNDRSNKDQQLETMLTCVDCGRSAHATCLPQLNHLNVEVVWSRPWRCANCKCCEICEGKDNEGLLLLCDSCDRGWHGSCLIPPITEAPEGDWFCSECPQPEPGQNHEPQDMGMNGYFAGSPAEMSESQQYDEPTDPQTPEPSTPAYTIVALSSRARGRGTGRGRPRGRGRGRGRPRGRGRGGVAQAQDRSFLAAASGTEDSEIDMTMDEPATTPASARLTRKHSQVQYSKKGKGRADLPPDDDDTDEELNTPSGPNHQPKRMRFRAAPPSPPALPKVKLRLTQKGKGKGKGKEREEDETAKGIFEDVLGETERDTTKTLIMPSDKQRFERSRAVAEDKLAAPRPAPIPESSTDPYTPIAGPSSRPLRGRSSTALNQPQALSTSSASPSPSTPHPEHDSKNGEAPTLRIQSIRFGAFEIKTWYDAPFPEEYANIPDGRLWICEFCLKYMKSKFSTVRHRMKCKAKHPPGDEIYRDGVVSIFEVDGRKNKIYCQNLCLLSKMYLDHKSLFYDVEPFLFYVITEVDDVGARFVGYFSKEKRSPKDYNVSCIMTLPVRQRQGWGNLLIDFSYLLSKKEQRTGSPEKPLSALGALGYKNYWTLSLMRYLETAPENPRLEDISAATSMTIEDIYNTLVQQNMITSRPVTPPSVRPTPGQSIKYIRGRRGGGSVARRNLQRTTTNTSERSQSLIGGDDTRPSTPNGAKSNHQSHVPKGPFVPPKEYEISWDPSVVETYLRNWEAKGYLRLRAEKLKWSPFLLVKGGLDGEVAVVKKTEAKGAVGTGTLLAGEGEHATEPGTGTLVNGLNGVGHGGSATPLSLFDDDNVVPANELDLDMINSQKSTPALTPSRSRRDSQTPAPAPSILASRSRRGVSALERVSTPSPSPRKGRKKTKIAEPAPSASPRASEADGDAETVPRRRGESDPDGPRDADGSADVNLAGVHDSPLFPDTESEAEKEPESKEAQEQDLELQTTGPEAEVDSEPLPPPESEPKSRPEPDSETASEPVQPEEPSKPKLTTIQQKKVRTPARKVNAGRFTKGKWGTRVKDEIAEVENEADAEVDGEISANGGEKREDQEVRKVDGHRRENGGDDDADADADNDGEAAADVQMDQNLWEGPPEAALPPEPVEVKETEDGDVSDLFSEHETAPASTLVPERRNTRLNGFDSAKARTRSHTPLHPPSSPSIAATTPAPASTPSPSPAYNITPPPPEPSPIPAKRGRGRPKKSVAAGEVITHAVAAKSRQLRSRAMAVESNGDTGVGIGFVAPPAPASRDLTRTGSLNGRKAGSQRKRKRVESSPESEPMQLPEPEPEAAHLPEPILVHLPEVGAFESDLKSVDVVGDDGTGDGIGTGIGDATDTGDGAGEYHVHAELANTSANVLSGSEEVDVASSLLSLLHSQPVVFSPRTDAAYNAVSTELSQVDGGNHPGAAEHQESDVDVHFDVKLEDSGADSGETQPDSNSRHSIPSDVTVFGTEAAGRMLGKEGDEQMDVDVKNMMDVAVEDGNEEDLGSADASGEDDDWLEEVSETVMTLTTGVESSGRTL